jgi:organic radical activating enzyme
VKLCNLRANICTTTPWTDDESGKKEEIDELFQEWMNQGYPTDYWDTESTMTSANNITF